MPSTFLVTSSDEFENAARAELRRYDSKLKLGDSLEPGLFLVSSQLNWDDFAAIVGQEPPIYARHLFPVHATVALTRTETDLDQLAGAVEQLPRLAELVEDTPFSVQARLFEEIEGQALSYPYTPFAIKERLAAVIGQKTGAVENIREPVEILSVVGSQGKAYLGLSPAELNLSGWPGGMRRLAKRDAQISRAELKLQEALEVFEVELPTGGEALDLGAAPGGWTRLLLEAGLRVTAIDPADLDPRLQKYAGQLSHYRGHAERFLQNALADKSRLGSYAVLVSDVRMDASMAAHLMVNYAPLLAPDGLAITTLKLPHESAKLKPAHLVEQALSILRQTYPRLRARQLFHNRSEITVLLRK
jgi:23S rRNA (cytidine2498-2'-O)-methyltransferase